VDPEAGGVRPGELRRRPLSVGVAHHGLGTDLQVRLVDDGAAVGRDAPDVRVPDASLAPRSYRCSRAVVSPGRSGERPPGSVDAREGVRRPDARSRAAVVRVLPKRSRRRPPNAPKRSARRDTRATFPVARTANGTGSPRATDPWRRRHRRVTEPMNPRTSIRVPVDLSGTNFDTTHERRQRERTATVPGRDASRSNTGDRRSPGTPGGTFAVRLHGSSRSIRVALSKHSRTDRIGVRDTEDTVSTGTALFSPSKSRTNRQNMYADRVSLMLSD
jgi:hypothetical protein